MNPTMTEISKTRIIGNRGLHARKVTDTDPKFWIIAVTNRISTTTTTPILIFFFMSYAW
jgi:hypothetical protein